LEVCDGEDNDCNGVVDDPWPEVGSQCDGSDTDECTNGTMLCNNTQDGLYCSAELLENIPETCNGIDDDCDGATDEFVCPIDDLDADGYTPDDGDCDDLRAEVNPGAVEPCCDPKLGAAGLTICDWDCNGVIIPCALADKDADGFSTPDDCDDASSTTYPGAPEKCGDGIDQDCVGGDLDCAGLTDNDGDGFQAGVDCNDGNPDIHPAALELCNFIDDDCDGIIDDGNPAGNVAPCGGNSPGCTPGKWACVHDLKTYTTQVLCVNEKFQIPEVCNGLDDDCDGEVDEIFIEKGESCDGDDSDQCANGVYTCTDDGTTVECVNEVVTDIQELCDNLDNDCDEQIDEDLNYEGIQLGAPCDGIGGCGAGVVVCTEVGKVVCSTNPEGPFSQAVNETCNHVDDDCDGEVDEGFQLDNLALGEACTGVGVCGDGVVECGSDEVPTCSTLANGSASQASPEVCNGVDDDCDGMVDEELGVEQSNCKLQGVCAEAEIGAQCVQGLWNCDYANVPSYEDDETLCDGLDNDCDGQVDDDMLIGSPCDGPDSDACAYGTWACADDGKGVVCPDEVVTDVQEACNGFDDDCDGIIDELDVDPVEAGCNTQGVCNLTAAIIIYCGAQQNECDYSQIPFYEPIETLCDGLDNDCDGEIDEGLTYDGLPLGSICEGKGECGFGLVTCGTENNQPICSSEPGGKGDQSKAEICNGLDDDCDGEIDEDYLWQGFPVGSLCNPGGICSTGLVECAVDGLSSTCSTAGGSDDQTSPEVCDGLDTDCDGVTDEIEDLNPVEANCLNQGVCGGPLESFVGCEEGIWVCKYDTLDAYQETENLCDGKDNDCDGEVDETHPSKGQACDGPDANECPTGTWTCNEAGDDLACVNETGVGTPEICDGADNDCDGLKDEGLSYSGIPLGFLCDGIGPCGAGYVECDGEGGTTCSTNAGGSQSQAIPEICNGIDDDCDGVVDNGLSWEGIPLGQPCDGAGACGIGFVLCSPVTGLPTCSTNPDGTTPQSLPETCNGVDDDCNGQTDEWFPETGIRCDGFDLDSCETGTMTCQDGELVCGGDFVCVGAAVCYDPGFPTPAVCLCAGQACNVQMGDTCDAGGCTCAGGSSCFPPETCAPGLGCQAPPP
jgi:hypothetical protein